MDTVHTAYVTDHVLADLEQKWHTQSDLEVTIE